MKLSKKQMKLINKLENNILQYDPLCPYDFCNYVLTLDFKIGLNISLKVKSIVFRSTSNIRESIKPYVEKGINNHEII